MNLTSEALRQLTAEAQVIGHRAAVAPVSTHHACQQLSAALQKLREKRTVIKLDRPKMNVKAAWSKFAAAQYDLNALDGLQFRALCCAEETAVLPELVAAIARDPDRLKRNRCLYGMVNGYFAEWRTMEQPGKLERLLVSAFEKHSAKNPVVQKWVADKRLFSEEAAAFLALEVCISEKAVDEVLHERYIGPLTKLGISARALAAKFACEVLQQKETARGGEWSFHYLQWITEKVLSDLTLPDAFSSAVSSLILSESAKRSETFQRALRFYVQSHKKLGDPRLRESSLNWRSIAPEAAQRYLSWLARDSINFFFNTILPNNSENQRRKNFWLRYHDRIKDFQVAVSETDLWKVRANQQNTDLLYYSQVAHPTTSAFIMKFEGYGGNFVIIEFSETNNAAYIYKQADFNAKRLTLRTPRFESIHHLKFDKAHRIFHAADWEPKAAYRLASEFGIRP